MFETFVVIDADTRQILFQLESGKPAGFTANVATASIIGDDYSQQGNALAFNRNGDLLLHDRDAARTKVSDVFHAKKTDDAKRAFIGDVYKALFGWNLNASAKAKFLPDTGGSHSVDKMRPRRSAPPAALGSPAGR